MNRLKELRQVKNLTQQELADIAEVTKRTYIYWEKDERQIKPDKAQVLADYFGVSTSVLLGYRDTTDSLGFRLWTLRNEKKLKVDEVAEKLHLSVDELKAIEKTDNATLGPSLAQDFAELYGVSVGYLLGIENEDFILDLMKAKAMTLKPEFKNLEKQIKENGELDRLLNYDIINNVELIKILKDNINNILLDLISALVYKSKHKKLSNHEIEQIPYLLECPLVSETQKETLEIIQITEKINHHAKQ